MKRNLIIGIALILQVTVINGQKEPKNILELKGAYLGQKPPGLTPEIFAPGIISRADTQEFAGTFSSDGKEFFFTRRPFYEDFEQQRIWHTKIENDRWTKPSLAPFTYDCFESEPYISPDGMRLYFGSRRPLPGKSTLNQLPAIWLSIRTVSGWSDPEYFAQNMMYMAEAGNRTLYYTALQEEGYIAVSHWNGSQYEAAKRLPDSVNCLRSTAHPFIAPDESYILYDGHEDETTNVRAIYVSFKKKDGSWERGVKLGHDVNTQSGEMCPSVSPDGQHLFFESARAGTMDIYWISAKVIEKLRPKQIRKQ